MTEMEMREAALRIICEYFNVPTAEILGKKKNKASCKPRHAVMFYFKNLLKMQWSEIGRYLGKNHSTVMHGHEQWKKDLRDGSYMDLDIKIKTTLSGFKPAPGSEEDFKSMERKVATYERFLTQMLGNAAMASVHKDIQSMLTDERRRPVIVAEPAKQEDVCTPSK